MTEQSAVYTDTLFGYINRTLPASKKYSPQLISNTGEATMLTAINSLLGSCQSFVFSVAFISSDGLAALKNALVETKARGTIITSTYLDFNDPDDLRELLLLENCHVYLADEERGFHAKGYIFNHEAGTTAIVGSSNLTAYALKVNAEWNLKFSAERDGDVASQLADAVQFQIGRAQPLTEELISAYERRRRRRVIVTGDDDTPLEANDSTVVIRPNAMQADALEELDKLYAAGEKRGLIISATGTGKTILAALAVKNVDPHRVLFLVHREQIAKKAALEFQKVLGLADHEIGFFGGGTQNVDARFTFATVQSLSKGENRRIFARSHFDYIIIDEVHRSGAGTYRKLIDYYTPGFLLGLSATPERTDGFNIFELFDYNVPYEIRLRDALGAKMLSPFHYYGITDYTDGSQWSMTRQSSLDELTSDERVDYIVSKLQAYGRARGVCGLIFCSRNEEATRLASMLNERAIDRRPLRTRALSGANTQEEREQGIVDLTEGRLDYLITVDIFNEGIDIPAINQVVLMRPTQSAIIFTQQLGRGLRKAAGKTHVRVIDFIANYDTNYLIPVALGGVQDGSKNTVRKHVRSPDVQGASTISFERIAQERILSSLDKVKLAGRREIRHDINTLMQRLQRVRRLGDFVNFELLSPDIVAAAEKPFNYWSLLHLLKFVDHGPALLEKNFLSFLSVELLAGKRPHELLILRELLNRGGPMGLTDVASLLAGAGTTSSPEVVASAVRVVTGKFFKDIDRARFGGVAPATIDDRGLVLDPDFATLYRAYKPTDDLHSSEWATSFRAHVDDLIDTGLRLCRIRGNWQGGLNLGDQYTRKDVCRLLGWDQNETATMFGYKVDENTKTATIFVTYHKGPDTDLSVSYEDEFLSPRDMVWFSKSGRTTSSPLEKKILSGAYTIHLFVKKHDSEGAEHYYLGTVDPQGAVDTFMPGKDKDLPVIKVDLELDSAVEESLYEYMLSTGSSELCPDVSGAKIR